MSPAERRRTHLRVAAALERLHADDLDLVSGRLAAHYEHGGDADAAISSGPPRCCARNPPAMPATSASSRW